MEEIELVEEPTVELNEAALVEKAKSLIDSKDGEGVLLYKTSDVFYAIPITKEFGKFGDIGAMLNGDSFKLLVSWLYSSPLLQEISHKIEVVNNNLAQIGMAILRSLNPHIAVSSGVNSPSGLIVPKGDLSPLLKK